jgi:hypothetical protein
MTRARLNAAFALALVILGASASPTLAAEMAKGKFRFGKVRFEPVDVLAYQQARNGGGPPVTIVALTNFRIDRPAVMAEIDTPSALVMQATRLETGVLLMVRILAPERCGLGGFLNETQQQIDLGESFPAKSVALTASRVAGECLTKKPDKMFDDEYEFRLSYDVPMTIIPKPAKLPAGGGEAGIAYAALVKAIQAADWNGAHLRLREDEVPKSRPKAADMSDYFHGVALNYPKTVTVAGGLIKGDRANLEIRGIDHDGKKIKGVVAMRKISGGWRVIEQSLYFAE